MTPLDSDPLSPDNLGDTLNDDVLADAAYDPEEMEESDATSDIIDTLTQELEESKNLVMRTMADFQNFRRRVQQEKEELRRYATENLVRELLPVLDNFERTVAASECGASMEALVEGVRMIDRQLRTALNSVSLVRIHATGMSFDPDRHEAIATDEASGQPAGTVTAEVEPGYMLGERIIRPARVRVAK
ncbi:MAG: nucleotide exchange factor GrpE [Chthonomonas sp.]|nr:nucleotide exchange factor GrpE [Chthonomonas sp.]